MTDPRLKRALAVIEKLEARLREVERPEAIAVVGCACRFPGADSPEDFWQGLLEERCTLGPTPSDRWAAPAQFKKGGFLNDVDRFDAHFFHISPREAESMDPQHRLLLELTWEALETADIVPSTLRGSATGVFVGMGAADYGLKRLYSGHRKTVDVYDGTGNTLSFASGRIAFVLGLNGPSLTTSTACSSSLVATHLGAQSLRLKESELAICCGVSLILEPDNGDFLSSSKALSPSGQCRPFDAEADGFVRGEGGGVVLLKRLSDARRDGNQVLAVLKASSVNSDGASAGLTAPNGEAQEALIKETLQRSGLSLEDIGYVECHGTATNLGDPIEVEALGRAFAQRKTPLSIGSVKANIGHLEGAAGMASFIKALKIIEHREIPPQINFQTPNPHVDWDAYPMRVDTRRKAVKPVVGVSGFGMSGTNVHLILAKPEPEQEEQEQNPPEPVERAQVLVLSARTPEALQDLVKRYIDMPFERYPIEDICASAALHREHFDHRVAVVADNREQLQRRLISFHQGERTESVWSGQRDPSGEPTVGFLFSGQGSQTAGMGEELSRLESTFSKPYRAYRAQLEKQIETLSQAWNDQSKLDQTIHTQPALVALEIALAKMWMSWGVEPTVLFGHSVGEISAACVAGLLPSDAALEFVASRGTLMQELPSGGGMTTAWAEPSALQNLLTEDVTIAALSTPQHTTLSGPISELLQIESKLADRGIKFKRLSVSHAFHSKLLDPCLEKLQECAQKTGLGVAEYPLISCLSGQLNQGEMSRASYWVEQARSPVQFTQAAATLENQGIDLFLELGPKPTLLSLGRQCLPTSRATWIASLRPQESEGSAIAKALARLYVAGLTLRWSEIWEGKTYRKISLPTYPWQRRRFWLESQRDLSVLHRLRSSGLLTLQELEKVEEALSNKAPKTREIPAYQVQWEPVSESSESLRTSSEHWLLTGLSTEHLEAVRAKLPKTVSTSLVKPEASEILEALKANPQAQKVLFLCHSLNSQISEPIEALSRLFGTINDVLKGMSRGSLHLLTGPACSIEGTSSEWTQAAVWGFGRALALEQSARWGGLLEIDSNSDWNAVTKALSFSQAALRQGQLRTPRLRKTKVPAMPIRLDPEKCFLITGGLGGLGLEIAHTLADLGARRILLLGRTIRPSQRLTELRGREVDVKIVLGDISDPETVTDLPSIHGVIHAAGFVADGLVSDLTNEQYQMVLRPKIQGLKNLAHHLHGPSLEFFLVTSSGAAILGNAGQANYCAANAGMSALAGELTAQGIPVSVVHWGAWNIGMAGRLSQVHKDRLQACGFQSFAAADMRTLLPPLLSSKGSHFVVADIDWPTFAQAFPARASSDFYPVLVETPKQELSLSALLERELKCILRLDSQSVIKPREGFFQLGLDSLMTAELASVLSEKSGLPLTPAAVLDHACLEDLGTHLQDLKHRQPTDASLEVEESQSDLERRIEEKFQAIVGKSH